MRFPLLMLLGFLFCGDAKVFASGTASMLRADLAEVDFGRTGRREVREAKVRLFNSGTEVVKISSVSTSCECTTASLSTMSVAAGEESTLTIKLETGDGSGSTRRMVVVHTSAGDLAVGVKLVIIP